MLSASTSPSITTCPTRTCGDYVVLVNRYSPATSKIASQACHVFAGVVWLAMTAIQRYTELKSYPPSFLHQSDSIHHCECDLGRRVKIAMIPSCHLFLELPTAVAIYLGPTLALHPKGTGWRESMTPSYTASRHEYLEILSNRDIHWKEGMTLYQCTKIRSWTPASAHTQGRNCT
jgi:hypothetical protein